MLYHHYHHHRLGLFRVLRGPRFEGPTVSGPLSLGLNRPNALSSMVLGPKILKRPQAGPTPALTQP